MNDLILVVEDQPDLAALLKDYLENANFRVHIIADGGAVIAWVKEFFPSVILLDLMLPGKDGLQVCREIRSFSQVPIMITTAKVDELNRIVGLEAGDGEETVGEGGVRLINVGGDPVDFFLEVLVEELGSIGRVHARGAVQFVDGHGERLV